MQLDGRTTFGLKAPVTQGIRFGNQKTATVTLSEPQDAVTLSEPQDTVTLSQIILPEKKEDPQTKLYAQLMDEYGTRIQITTFQALQALPEFASLIEQRILLPQTALQIVPEERQGLVQQFFQHLAHSVQQPAQAQIDDAAFKHAKMELPEHSDKELRDILAGKDVKVAYEEVVPKARITQFQKEAAKTLQMTVKDAMLAGLREMQDFQKRHNPEAIEAFRDDLSEATASKVNPTFSYL